jgi:hypothetical protein
VIRWPSGRVDKFGPVKADQEILVEEGGGVIEAKSTEKAK